MGLSGSKTTTTTAPSATATPYLVNSSSTIQQGYDAAKPAADRVGASLLDAFDRFNTSRQSNPLTTGSNAYLGRVINGDFLDGNPEMDSIINQTNDSITDRVNSIFSRSGQTGSSRQIGELGKQLSDNESRLRYQNYGDEQARIMQAIQAALAGRSADNQDMATLLGLGQGAVTVPQLPAQAYAAGMGGLWGDSQTQTTKQSGNVLQGLLGLGGAALGGWATGGFK